MHPLYVNWCEVTITDEATGELLYHTVLDLCDILYRLVRAELVARRAFFDDLQALTRNLFFPSWQVLLQFMAADLELDTS